MNFTIWEAAEYFARFSLKLYLFYDSSESVVGYDHVNIFCWNKFENLKKNLIKSWCNGWVKVVLAFICF